MAKRDKSFKLQWVSLKNISLATAAREAGFDLAVYDDYSENTRIELRKRTIKQALLNLENEYEKASQKQIKSKQKLSEIEYGVYVIRLSNPFTVRYRFHDKMNSKNRIEKLAGTSQIVYIGKGTVRTRLENHFQDKLFDFMLSLSGANFDFQIVKPYSPHYSEEDLHTQLEHNLLCEFSHSVCEEDKSWPLLNKNSGIDRKVDNCGDNWNYPLRRDIMNIEWSIEPTEKWKKTYLSKGTNS